MRVYRGNIKSALKSTSRERQYVSRPGIVGHEILEQSASTERLKFIVHSGPRLHVRIAILCDHGSAQNGNRVPNTRLSSSLRMPEFDERVEPGVSPPIP